MWNTSFILSTSIHLSIVYLLPTQNSKSESVSNSSFLQDRRRHVFSFERDLIFLGFERVEDAMSGSIVGQRTNATLKFLRFNGDRFESDRFVGNRGNNPRKRSCPLETRGRSNETRPRKQRYMRPLRVKDDQGHRGETVISLCRDTVAHLTDAISRMMRYVCSRLIKISIKR